jgi:hypothetical protein
MEIIDNWLPTIENINALPEQLRNYIHEIEATCDPAGLVRENTILRDTVNSLEKELIEKR